MQLKAGRLKANSVYRFSILLMIFLTESRAIEQQGGYQFDVSVIPNTFAFGGQEESSTNVFGRQP